MSKFEISTGRVGQVTMRRSNVGGWVVATEEMLPWLYKIERAVPTFGEAIELATALDADLTELHRRRYECQELARSISARYTADHGEQQEAS